MLASNSTMKLFQAVNTDKAIAVVAQKHFGFLIYLKKRRLLSTQTMSQK